MKKNTKFSQHQRTLTNQIRTFAFLVGASALLVLANGCANDESGRKSAVDAAKLCGGAKDVVFAGSCLERGSSLGAGDPKPPPDQGLPDESGARNPAGSPTETTPVVEGSPKVTPDNPPPVPDKPPPGEVVVPSGGGKDPVDTTPVKGAVAQILSFSRDSFVAIADQVVKGNCFVPKGTTIEFKGDFAPVTQFKSFGVNQNIALDVVAVKYPEGQSGSSVCNLEGKNFVYLAGHAEVAAKP